MNAFTPALPLSIAARLLGMDMRELRALIAADSLPVYRRRGREVVLTEDVVGVLTDRLMVPVEYVFFRSEIFTPADLPSVPLPPGKWFGVRCEGVGREQFDYVVDADGWTELPDSGLDSPSAARTKAQHMVRDTEGNLPSRLAVFNEVSGASFFARDRAAAEQAATLLRLAEPI
jgi:hypothetical protein